MIFDNLKNASLYYSNHKNFEKGFDFIKKALKENLPAGKYEIDGKDLYASILEYDTKKNADGKTEGHRNYIDIQFIVWGEEVIKDADISKVQLKTDYNPDKDVEFYYDTDKFSLLTLESGDFAIFFPCDIHKPSIAVNDNPAPVKKIVVKVKI